LILDIQSSENFVVEAPNLWHFVTTALEL
jgi:hypothetical protein